MNVNKNNIVKNLTKESLITNADGSSLLEAFIELIKEQSKQTTVKISGFGTFCFKKTPKRIGRNPKNKVSYIIPERSKLNFKPSNKLKSRMN